MQKIKTNTTQLTIELQYMELVETLQKHRIDCKCDLSDNIISNLPILEFSYYIHDLSVPELSIQVIKEGYVKYIDNNTQEVLGRSKHLGSLTYDEIKKSRLDYIQDDREITVRLFVEKYLTEEINTLKPSTIRDYKAYLSKFILPVLGSRKIANLRLIDIQKIHRSLERTPYQANRVLAVMSKMISYAKRCEIFDRSNPCRQIKKFTEKQRSRYLSKEEVARVGKVLNNLATTDQHKIHNLMIYFLLQTGSRFSEMVYLKKSQIKNGNIYWETTKTGSKTLPISPRVQEILNSACQLNEFNDNVFYKELHTTGDSLRNYWKKVKKLANIPDLRMHDLRHSFASMSLENGVGIEHIREILNHKSIVTTQRYNILLVRLLSKPWTE